MTYFLDWLLAFIPIFTIFFIILSIRKSGLWRAGLGTKRIWFRTFLQYNKSFEAVLVNTYMEYAHESFFREKMPLCMKNPGGSIWIRKVSK
jgi:hypothetical protein